MIATTGFRGGRFAYSGVGWESAGAHNGRDRGKSTVHRRRSLDVAR